MVQAAPNEIPATIPNGAKGRRVVMPTDACSRRIFVNQQLRKISGRNACECRGARLDGQELGENFRRGAKDSGGEGVAQTKMNDSALCRNALKLEFVKRQRIHEGEQALLLLNGEEVRLENESVRELANGE
jgi:hypothetical protein